MSKKKIVILACSGASNTGAYSDKVARKLMRDGKAMMMCLARFSIDKQFAETTKNELLSMDSFGEVVTIDGCPINCAELTLKDNGIEIFSHVMVTDFGIVKGKTPVSEEKVNEIANHVLTSIQNQTKNELEEAKP